MTDFLPVGNGHGYRHGYGHGHGYDNGYGYDTISSAFRRKH